MTLTPDTELILALGPQRAVVSPYGASLGRYFLLEQGTDIVWGYCGAHGKKGGQGDVLIPFPGRVAQGRYQFEGQTLQLECTDKEGPNAIHGFLRSVLWTIQGTSPSHVSFEVIIEQDAYRRRGYPFSLAVELSYRLDLSGLSCDFTVQNIGPTPAPVGVGFHPYFTVGTDQVDDAEVQIPASHYLEFGDTLTPTGTVLPVEGTPWDYREYRRVGETRLNHCYMNLQRNGSGTSTARLDIP